MVPPIAQATLQAAGLNAISNIVGQLLTSRQASAHTSLSINVVELAQFVMVGTLLCPPNYIWQSYLEAQFPGYTTELAPLAKEKLVDEVVSGQSTSSEKTSATSERRSRNNGSGDESAADTKLTSGSSKEKSNLNWTNTAIKFSLDQTLGTVVNILIFMVGMAWVRGDSWQAIAHEVHSNFLSIMLAGQKFWPIVSLASFTLVPVQHRTLFGSVAGLFWGIYLSIVSSKG